MVLAALAALFKSEATVVRVHRALLTPMPGLELALRYSAQRLGIRRLPAIAVYQDPLPSARVVRGFFGPGKLMLSQGLLSTFRDDEVVAVMHQGLQLLSQRGIAIKSICSAWLLLSERSRRETWTPWRAMTYWTLLPLRNGLQRRDRDLDIFRSTALLPVADETVWRNALRKVSSSERIFS